MSDYLLCFDSETGDLDPKNGDLLTAYFAIVDEDFKVVEELDLKMKPDGGRLPIANEGALRVNGINLIKHIEDPATITYSEARLKLVSLIKKYLKKKGRYSNIRSLGYNVNFDIGWIQEHVLPKSDWDSMIHYSNVDPKNHVELFKDAGWFPKEVGTLVSVVEYLGISKGKAHTAKDDTLMTLEVYKKILEMLKSKKENTGGTQDLISLLEAE